MTNRSAAESCRSWRGRLRISVIPPRATNSRRPPSRNGSCPSASLSATIFTTLWAGAYQAYNGPIRGPVNLLLEQPETLWHGIPFAATLLTILVTHECGHYVLSRIHGVPASLPLFIPGPPYFVGTFGAIIRLRGPIMNRRALFDIGVAGPLAGFIVAVVALVIGLNLSTVVDRTATHGLQLGEPLLLQFICLAGRRIHPSSG